MRRSLLIACAAGVVGIPSAASACLYPPPPPGEAGESDADYQARSIAALNAYLKEGDRKTQAGYFKEANAIYFARIVSSEEIKVGGSPYARRVTVQPLEAIRGKLPPGRLTLKDRELTSCGLDGDGPATSGHVSHIVVVFSGVRNEGMSYRSATYAVMASEAQQPELVQAWARWKAHAHFSYDE